MLKKDDKILAFYLGLVFLLRFHTFYIPVIDSDETSHLVIAQSLLRGYTLYSDIWDLKPPGIHFLFSLGLLIFGQTIFTIRLLTCLTVTLSCFFLYKIGKIFNNNGDSIGILAGLFYAFASLKSGGLAANIEIFFVPWVLLAIGRILTFFLSPPSKQTFHLLMTGFILGIAIEFKHVVIYDIFSIIGIVLLQTNLLDNNPIKEKLIKGIKRGSILCCGILIPVIAVILFFIAINQFKPYFFANFTVLFLYTDNPLSLIDYFQAIKEQFFVNPLLWLGLLLSPLSIYVSSKNDPREQIIIYSLWLWMFFIAIGLFVTFKSVFLDHYFIQLYPSLCLIAAYTLIKIYHWLISYNSKISVLRIRVEKIKWLFVLFLLLCLTPSFFNNFFQGLKFFYIRQVKGVDHWKRRPPERIANYLQKHTDHNDYIYIVNYEPTLIYFLSGAKVATKYPIHTQVFSKKFRSFIDPVKEVDEVMKKQPKYVLFSKRSPLINQDHNIAYTKAIENYLQRFYVVETTIQGHEIYRLRSTLKE